MRKSQITEEQLAPTLREAETASAADVASNAALASAEPLSAANHARMADYVAEIDAAGVILATSSSRLNTTHNLVGSNVRRWLDPKAHGVLDRALAEAFAQAEPRSFQWNGVETGRLHESQISPLWSDGATTRAVLTTRDVAARKLEEDALRESEQRFRALVEGAFEGLQISISGRIVVANQALARMAGWRLEDMLDRSGADFCTPESFERAMRHARHGLETPYEVTGLRKDGSTFPCEILGRNILYQGKPARLTAFRDITDRRRLERERSDLELQMQQAQKLESLGMLAGGIAHDVNNVLMAVLANAEVALKLQTAPDATTVRLDSVRTAALQGRELMRQLLNYAAHGPLTQQAVDLNELVRDTAALLGVSITKKAELSLQLSDENAVVYGDPSQLRQLVMNLVINASDALAESSGQIEVRVERVQVTPKDLEGSQLHAEIPDGKAVAVHVTDTGHGMDKGTLGRIFEPFFSTKRKGHGLGLASVLNIVRGHRGAIRVKSEPGRGTHFTVWLAQSDACAVPHHPPPQPPATCAMQGLVLVADDEPMLRSVTHDILVELGFEVLLAEDGQSALQAYEDNADRIVLVILDLTMPKQSGLEALRRLRARNEHIPVLCTSGYSAEKLGSEIETDPDTRFLAKPYSLSELTAAINALLWA